MKTKFSPVNLVSRDWRKLADFYIKGFGHIAFAVENVEEKLQLLLEPDGAGSHWFSLTSTLRENAKVAAGDTVGLEIESSNNWPEPVIPEDLETALEAAPDAHIQWNDITPMARWDWIRWISATSRPATRRRRIEAACDKLRKGERRPCCFNRTLCTDPTLSKNGVLMEPQ